MSDERQRWVVDAIEERMASVEVDGDKMITVPLATLPPGVRQGHVLAVVREMSADGKRATLTIEIDEAATTQALAASAAQVESIRRQSAKRDPGGDVTL
ncbi:MAG TPA: DUF3006 domain-containing protein [Gemmatimonadaceae bacterium]|nr:DUF3006 domain-containing protein [Gemmatimonadaceae bacterium]